LARATTGPNEKAKIEEGSNIQAALASIANQETHEVIPSNQETINSGAANNAGGF
jgi:hypothetical protein